MDIRVSGHQVETGAALQQHVSDRLNDTVDKYFSRAISSHVTFGKAGSAFSCDIVVHVMQGMILKSHAEAYDAHESFDKAAEKIDKQLRRYKRRIQDRHQQTAFAAEQENAAYRVFAGSDEEAEDIEVPESLPVIAETTADIPETSVADAVMMLDLRHTNALFFKNAGTGRHNMVYRRQDGSVGWVEPH